MVDSYYFGSSRNILDAGRFNWNTALVVAIIWLIAVLVYNSNRGDNLAISLNSGSTLYFNCKDRAFLNKVVNAMLGSIKEKNQTTYSISFDKCQISGGVLHNSNLIER